MAVFCRAGVPDLRQIECPTYGKPSARLTAKSATTCLYNTLIRVRVYLDSATFTTITTRSVSEEMVYRSASLTLRVMREPQVLLAQSFKR